MRFSGYSFGSVRVDGVTYDHDLVIDGVELVIMPTPQAVSILATATKDTNAILHLTC